MSVTGSEIDIYRNEVIALRELLGNLLAVIHRDGGQHTAEVGLVEATREATEISSARISRVAELEDRLRGTAAGAVIGLHLPPRASK